jgi:hypothetical protein
MSLVESEPKRNYSGLVYEVLAEHVRAFARHMPLHTSITLTMLWLWHRNVMHIEMEKEGHEQGAVIEQLLQETNMCLDAMECVIYGDRLPDWLRMMPSLVQDPEGCARLSAHFARVPQIQVNVNALLRCLIY